MMRRIVIGVVVAAVVVVLLRAVMYEVVAVDWVGFMEDQPSKGYLEPPLLQAAEAAVPISRPAWHDVAGQAVNPVPADEVSLQRGEVLFSLHCAVCHGSLGAADGPVLDFWREDARRPANLTEARIGQYPDAGLYRVITQGIGTMPPLRENMNERQIWDVVNHVHTLQP